MNKFIKIQEIGTKDYKDTWEYQEKLFKEIIDISSKNLKIEFDTTKPEGDVGRYPDISNAKNILDWQPKISLRDGLVDTYHWIDNDKKK